MSAKINHPWKKRVQERKVDIILAIRESMRQKGISVKRLAKEMEITPMSVSCMLSLNNNMGMENLIKIEEVLKIKIFNV